MMGNIKKIACVIVTFNRKTLLKRCIEAVSAQKYKAAAVYIVDNASTDGTIDSVKEWGFYECVRDGIPYRYILNSKNEGGAGGFYLGMKTAFDDGGFDGIWVMDDDGVPEKECLKNLVGYLDHRDYIASCVLSIENPDVGFGIDHPNYRDTLVKYPKGVIEGVAAPFNGILYSTRLVKKIGFPKREMFIWGDEVNYHLRAIKGGMPPITILKAIHYHPYSKQSNFKYKGKLFCDINQNWKLYCYLRNLWYNRLRYGRFVLYDFFSVIYNAFMYVVGYKRVKHNNIGTLVFDAVICAIIGKFDRLSIYMKK